MAHKKQQLARVAIVLLIAASSMNANAQDWKTEKRVNVLFGISQVLLHGFNIEGNYISNRLIVDYSHGVSLEVNGNNLPEDLRRQGVVVHMPWTTGFGVGYRFAEWINVRVEPKMHRFEFYYDNEEQSKSNQITAYNAFSLGLGIYGNYRPFKKMNNYLNGITIAPSVRYWPTIATTMNDSKFTYYNKHTSSMEEIKTLNAGIGFTPLVINVSVGYSFKIKKQK
jgi:hypothetical protein